MSKCFSTLRRLASRPTRRFIFSRPRNLDPLRRTIPAMRSRIASVACRRSSRLRARSSRKRGLRHTIRRSPGKSGLRISATASGCNPAGCSGAARPSLSGLSSLRRSAVFNAESQSSPAGATVSRMRAVVSMPRSPTRAMRRTPKRPLSLATCVATVAGSAVLPANTSTAIGQPSPVHNSPIAICCLPRLPSRLWPNLASGQHRPSR